MGGSTQISTMVLLPALASAKEALSASLGRAMSGSPSPEDGPSLVRQDGDPYLLPRLKPKSGEEPRISRLKSPGLQDGQWVIHRRPITFHLAKE